MAGRYGIAICVSSTVSLNLAGSSANPGLITIISQGMASWAARVRTTVAAARVASASDASLSAAGPPSAASFLE
jgi:hypothetical protein